LPSWPASIEHPIASGGAFFVLSIPSDSGSRGRGPALPRPGTENPEMPHSKRFLTHLSVPPPSFDLFASPPPHPIQLAPAEPQSAARCFQTGAASDGSRPARNAPHRHFLTCFSGQQEDTQPGEVTQHTASQTAISHDSRLRRGGIPTRGSADAASGLR
jgi:hypothetical protein